MIKSKVRSLFRYVIAFALIFGTVTLNENSKAVDTAGPDETFEGKSVRCVIDIDRSKPAGAGYKTGFSYALLSEFSEAVDAKDIAIYTAGKDYDWADSLKSGKVDIVVISESEEIDDEEIILSRRLDNTVWAVNRKDLVKVKELNNWIARFSKSEEYERLWKKYNNTGADPFYALAKGRTVTCLSPYDKLIKEYAGKIDWDWRMLAALIYQESKFSIDTRSHRGATGLMQVMPATAKAYGIEDLLNPEENIKAGTMHIRRLENMYRNAGMTEEEKIKFVLASYNAGEGRIADCRNFAASRNLDNTKWEDILQVIPEMRKSSILEVECVKFGRFSGTETINYVDNIMRIYSAFCEICPA